MPPLAVLALTAIDNLPHIKGLKAKWLTAGAKDHDGKIEIVIHGKKETFFVVVKKEFRNHHIPDLITLAGRYKPLMIIAQNIFPAIKEAFRKHNIAYIDTAGNIYLNTARNFIWIDGRKDLPVIAETPNRAFTKTGLKVLFHLLLEEDLINEPYRKIAEITGTAIGNINNIYRGLKEQGFIENLDDKRLLMVNKPALLDRWITGYANRLKPALHIGNFRFVNPEDERKWENIKFKNTETQWGSEPAAAVITKYLYPEMFTIYTTEQRIDLIKKHHFVPDNNGNIRIFKMFWKPGLFSKKDALCVPPLLIYTDLINTGDPRNIETAQKIYNQYVQPILK
jgi:hypothetical protein